MATEHNNHDIMNKKARGQFWNPWGTGGCLWRSILFLLGLILLCFLFALLLRGCDKNVPLNPFSNDERSDNRNGDNPFEHPIDSLDNPYRDIPPELKDSVFVDDWIDSIPDVKELPSPKDNYIPPVDSTEVIINPEDSTSYIVGDQLIVFFNSKDLKQDMADFARQFKQAYPGNGYQISYYNPVAGTMLLTVPQTDLLKVADELPSRITGIDFAVTTNTILNETAQPSDPGFKTKAYDDYFNLIQAYDAWDITRGSKDVKVAIVDSYFDLSNPEIGERYTDRVHIPSKTNHVMPPNRQPRSENELTSFSHGSHVAGIAIGAQNNSLGTSGIAPECSWIPVALGDQLTSFNILEGILYAIYHGADVVNISIGRNLPPYVKDIPLDDQVRISSESDKRGEALWEYIIKTANDHNCVLVTAAGNNSVLMGLDPMKRSDNLVKVEAVDGKGQMASFSNFGMVPESGLSYSTVAAPGVNIWSTTPKVCATISRLIGKKADPSTGFQEMDGTSMASPMVAGAVALLKSKNKNLTTREAIDILVKTAKQTDKKHRIGPTIQLRDALNATTTGERLNFDDLMKNHNLLLGRWRSTNQMFIESNGKKVDDIWTYFTFNDTNSGTIEMQSIKTGKVYSAPLRVSWGPNTINITQLRDAVAPDGQVVSKDDFSCHPNKDRLLETACMRNGVTRYNFMLEKVK